jgi:hypothetical protein
MAEFIDSYHRVGDDKQYGPCKNQVVAVLFYFPLFFENSSTTSPAQEKKSPANMKLCNRYLRGFKFFKNKIISTGMISALTINPG